MIDLREVITKYPKCLESPAKFRSYLSDLYPEPADRARIKVLTDVMACGIVDKLRSGKTDPLSITQYRTTMEQQYGYSARLVMESITKWREALGVELTSQSAVDGNETAQPAATSPTPVKRKWWQFFRSAPEPAPEPAASKQEFPPVREIEQGPHIHKFADKLVVGNCQERGYTLHRCKCGYEYRDSFTPTGEHRYDLVDELPASCTQAGRREYLCAICSDYKAESIPAIGHTYGHWKTVKEAGCEEEGIQERKCVRCGETERQPIPKRGHRWGDWSVQIVAGCTEAGRKQRRCSRCGEVEEVNIPPIGHNFTPWEESKKRPNMAERFCRNCGEEQFCLVPEYDKCEFIIKNLILIRYIGHKTAIQIPSGVTGIGNRAFSGCRFLTSIDIPNSVTSIGEGAFYNCPSISSIEIPNSVTNIGAWAFCGCKSLENIKIPDSVTDIGHGAFNGTPWFKLRREEEYVVINGTLIKYTGKGDHATIPNSVTSIGDAAFWYCKSLTSITIPNSVTSIGNEAFWYCESLTSITIPNSVTNIGEGAFRMCTSLTSIEIPNSVTNIGGEAFKRTPWFESRKEDYVVINGNLIKYNGKEDHAVIPNGVTSIGDKAFSGCKSLISIRIPNGVTSIGKGAFSGCTSLASIEIPGNVTSIGEGAFQDNPWLEKRKEDFVVINGNLIKYNGKEDRAVIPDGVTGIDNSAFSGCTSLFSREIPSSVTSIGAKALYDCTSLISIEIPDSVTSIGASAFYGCKSLISIKIPYSVTSIGEHAFWNCESLASIMIPNGVTSIENGVFGYCRSLTNIEIPDSVTNICDQAFKGCFSLRNIVIPNGVTDIWGEAFCYCGSLYSIEIPNSVTRVHHTAFKKCNSLASITIPAGLDAFFVPWGCTIHRV